MLVAKTLARDGVIYFIAPRNIIDYHGIQRAGIIWNTCAAALVHLLTAGKVGKSNQNETKSLCEERGSRTHVQQISIDTSMCKCSF